MHETRRRCLLPGGPDRAHGVANPATDPARFVMFSSALESSVAVYPDSGKVVVWAPGVDFVFRTAEGKIPYYAGEV
jgi:uncharacterized cupin superfamily protein